MNSTFSVIPVKGIRHIGRMLVHDFTICCKKTNRIISVLDAYMEAVEEDKCCINDIGTVTFNAVVKAENDIKTFKATLKDIINTVGTKIEIINDIKAREPFIVSPVNYYRIYKMRQLHRFMVVMEEEVDELLKEVEAKRIETLNFIENLGL